MVNSKGQLESFKRWLASSSSLLLMLKDQFGQLGPRGQPSGSAVQAALIQHRRGAGQTVEVFVAMLQGWLYGSEHMQFAATQKQAVRLTIRVVRSCYVCVKQQSAVHGEKRFNALLQLQEPQ